jgi:tetratricopeptide (TPR) repeat protein
MVGKLKLIISAIIIAATALPSHAISRDEMMRKIANANELRLRDSRSAVKVLHDIFIEECDNGMYDQCARTLAYTGWALYNCNYPDLAIQMLSCAQTYCHSDSTATRNLITLCFGACYAATDNYAKGEQLLLSCLERSRKDGNNHEVMMTCTYLGDLYSNQAKEAKAKECFEEGRQIAHSLNDSVFESALLCNIGTLCNDSKEAEEYFFKSIDLCQQIADRVTECYAYINLAELYFNNHDYTKALRVADQVNRFMPYISNDIKAIAYYHKLLSLIYAAQNKQSDAYNQLMQASEKNSMGNSRIAKERAEFNSLIIDMLRQSEDFKLNKQKAEQTNKFKLLSLVIFAVVAVAVIIFILYCKSMAQRRLLIYKNNEILSLQETKTRQTTEISDTRRTMTYLYGYYRGRNSLLDKLSQMVKDAYRMNASQLPSHLRNVNTIITQCLTKEKEPEAIKQLDTEVNAFVERLKTKYPAISKTDIMLAVSYRLGLSTRDIAKLSGKLTTTITTARYRLRTSLNLPEEIDLYEFFNNI